MFYRLLSIIFAFVIYIWVLNIQHTRTIFKIRKRLRFVPVDPKIISKATFPPLFNFSACLLIKDDNQILPEWIAYHFTVLPLRHLIVAVDPFSLTSPTPILDKFREIGVDIDVWRDKNYLYKDKIFWKRIKSLSQIIDSKDKKVKVHRIRQSAFYERCLKAFKRQNLTWTALIDTDEYLTYNHFDSDEGQPLWFDRMSTLSGEERSILTEQFNASIKSGEHPRQRLPQIGQVTIAQYISDQVRYDNPRWAKFSCVLLPRVQFGAVESNPEQVAVRVPSGFDPLSFHTFRYRFHGPKQQANKPGKSLVNLVGFDNRKIFNPHKIMAKKCTSETAFPDFTDSDLRVHHYTGSLDLFLSRPEDSRRSVQEFRSRNEIITGYDDSIRGWLRTFVSLVGKDKAIILTKQLQGWAQREDAVSLQRWKIERENFSYPFFDHLSDDLEAQFTSSSLLKELDPTVACKRGLKVS